MLLVYLSNIKELSVSVELSATSIWFHRSINLCLFQYCAAFITTELCYRFKSGVTIPPLVWLPKIFLAILAYLHVENRNWNPISTICQIKIKMNQVLNIKPEKLDLLEGKINTIFEDIVVGKDFLNRT